MTEPARAPTTEAAAAQAANEESVETTERATMIKQQKNRILALCSKIMECMELREKPWDMALKAELREWDRHDHEHKEMWHDIYRTQRALAADYFLTSAELDRVFKEAGGYPLDLSTTIIGYWGYISLLIIFGIGYGVEKDEFRTALGLQEKSKDVEDERAREQGGEEQKKVYKNEWESPEEKLSIFNEMWEGCLEDLKEND